MLEHMYIDSPFSFILNIFTLLLCPFFRQSGHHLGWRGISLISFVLAKEMPSFSSPTSCILASKDEFFILIKIYIQKSFTECFFNKLCDRTFHFEWNNLNAQWLNHILLYNLLTFDSFWLDVLFIEICNVNVFTWTHIFVAYNVLTPM